MTANRGRPDVRLLAALDAGLLDEATAREVRAAADADPAARAVLAALAATRAELAALPDPPVPPALAERWSAALAAEQSRLSAPTPQPQPIRPRRRRRPTRIHSTPSPQHRGPAEPAAAPPDTLHDPNLPNPSLRTRGARPQPATSTAGRPRTDADPAPPLSPHRAGSGARSRPERRAAAAAPRPARRGTPCGGPAGGSAARPCSPPPCSSPSGS